MPPRDGVDAAAAIVAAVADVHVAAAAIVAAVADVHAVSFYFVWRMGN